MKLTLMAASAVTWSAVGGFGAFSVGFIAKDQPDLISACLYGFAFGISALVSPIFSKLAGAVRMPMAAGCFLIAGAATILDGFGLSRAYTIMQDGQAKADYAVELKAYQDQRKADEDLIASTTAQILSMAPPMATDTYTSRIEAASRAYESNVATLNGIIAKAEERLAAIDKPAAPVLTSAEDRQAFFIVGVLIQSVLALAFMLIGRIERGDTPKAQKADGYRTERRPNGLELMIYGKNT